MNRRKIQKIEYLKYKIKLKDDYFYNKTDARIEDQNGSFYALSAQGTTYNKLKITATNQANSSKAFSSSRSISGISWLNNRILCE